MNMIIILNRTLKIQPRIQEVTMRHAAILHPRTIICSVCFVVHLQMNFSCNIFLIDLNNMVKNYFFFMFNITGDSLASALVFIFLCMFIALFGWPQIICAIFIGVRNFGVGQGGKVYPH